IYFLQCLLGVAWSGAEISVALQYEPILQYIIRQILRGVLPKLLIAYKAAFYLPVFHFFFGIPTFSVIKKCLVCAVGERKSIAVAGLNKGMSGYLLRFVFYGYQDVGIAGCDAYFRATRTVARGIPSVVSGIRRRSGRQRIVNILIADCLFFAFLFKFRFSFKALCFHFKTRGFFFLFVLYSFVFQANRFCFFFFRFLLLPFYALLLFASQTLFFGLF